MHCNSCAQIIERSLKNKVNKIYVSYSEEEAIIDFDEHKISEKEILEIINKLGYGAKPLKNIKEDSKIDKIAKDVSELKAETKKIEALEEEIEGREEDIESEIKELKEDKMEKENSGGVVKSVNGFEKILLWSIIIIIPLLLLYKFTGFNFSNFSLPNIQIPELGKKTSLILLFLAGILTGFHCISMCGGFVVSYTAKNAINGYKGFKQHLVYGG